MIFIHFFVFSFCIQPAHSRVTAQAVKNISGIKVKKGAGDSVFCFKNKADKCSGSVLSKKLLEKVGRSKEEFQAGVACVAADFDNNGSLDFAISGAAHSKMGWESRDNLVLLFDGSKIIFEKVIPNQAPLCRYGPTSHRGRHGEPKTKLPGLIRQGEGDITNIFIWSKKKRDFVNSEYGSGE